MVYNWKTTKPSRRRCFSSCNWLTTGGSIKLRFPNLVKARNINFSRTPCRKSTCSWLLLCAGFNSQAFSAANRRGNHVGVECNALRHSPSVIVAMRRLLRQGRQPDLRDDFPETRFIAQAGKRRVNAQLQKFCFALLVGM